MFKPRGRACRRSWDFGVQKTTGRDASFAKSWMEKKTTYHFQVYLVDLYGSNLAKLYIKLYQVIIFHQPGSYWNSRSPISLPKSRYILGCFFGRVRFLLDVPRRKLGSMVGINGLFHLLPPTYKWDTSLCGYNPLIYSPLILTSVPGHPNTQGMHPKKNLCWS